MAIYLRIVRDSYGAEGIGRDSQWHNTGHSNISSVLSPMLSGGPERHPGISPMFIATSRIAPDSTLAMVAL